MAVVMPGLERRLKAELTGEVQFDRFTRGRYATDASHYQIMPVGVVAPRTIEEADRAIAIARSEGATLLARGGGTSQAGQTVGESLVIDCSKYLTRVLDLDIKRARSRSNPASCWTISIASSSRMGFGSLSISRPLRAPPSAAWPAITPAAAAQCVTAPCATTLFRSKRCSRTARSRISAVSAAISRMCRHRCDLWRRTCWRSARARRTRSLHEFPKVQRRVGGYNLDALVPGKNDINLAHVLVGGEGTLAFSTRVELKLSPLLGRRAVGACHFGSFYEAMNAAQHIVRLKPIAVELIDRTMIGLARQIPIFKPTLEKFVRETPEAILLVEFGEDDHEVNLRMLQQLKELMGDLGFGWDKSGTKWGGVVEILNPDLQAAIADVRTSGLNIMMSMKEEGKPVSFVEDCAVPLEHLADYTSRLTEIFEKHGTRGTWYAHAGSGCSACTADFESAAGEGCACHA